MEPAGTRPLGDASGGRAPRPSRSWGWVEPAAIFLLALGLNLAGNDRIGLWDRDEPRYAVCVREMRDRGDWIHPTFNGEPRYHKPVLIYWLMGLTTALAGDNPFGARLVSSLAGAGTVLTVGWLGRRMFGGGGRLAGLILATAPIVVAEAKLATTDATLALWVCGCQVALWVLGRGPSRSAAGAFWVLVSLATLTKGPVGPALILASSLLAWWWGWKAPPWQRLHGRWGLVVFLALTAPWFVTVSILSRGEFLRFAVGNQIVQRVASSMEEHGAFPGYYPVVSLLVFFPWSVWVPAAILGGWMRRKSNSDLSFLLGWAIGPMLLLECFRTKLIHYYLPAYPACALLVTWLIHSAMLAGDNLRNRPLGRLGMALLMGITVGLAVILVAGTILVPGPLRAPMVVAAGTLAGGMSAGTLWFRRGANRRAVAAMVATWTALHLILAGWLLPMGEPYRTSRVVGRRLAKLSAELGLKPVLIEYQEPGLIYSLGRPVALTRGRESFLAHLGQGRAVLTVAAPGDVQVLRGSYGLHVTPVDRVEGYDLNKGKYHVLDLAIVRRPASKRSGTGSIPAGVATIAPAPGSIGQKAVVE